MVVSRRWTLWRLVLRRSHHELVEKIPVEIVGRQAAAAGSRTWWMVDGIEARADGNGIGHGSICMTQELVSHVFSARLEPAIEKTGSRCNLVRLLIQEGGSLQHNLERGQLGRLILLKNVLQRELVQGSRVYQAPVILCNLDLEPIVHELTASCAVGQDDRGEGIWIGLGKGDHVQPGNGVHKGMGRDYFDGAVKESFNASEETGSCQSGPETRC